MTPDLTFDDLLTSLDSLLSTKKIPGAFSVSEMAQALGRPPNSVSRVIKRLVDSGLVEFAGREKRKTIADTWNMTPVYRRTKGKRV